jgi:type VI secretion system protein ImpL
VSSWFQYIFQGIERQLTTIIVLGISAIGAILLGRRSLRWLGAIILAITAVMFLLVLPRIYPPQEFLDSNLPSLFRNHFWAWVWVFVLGMILSINYLVRALRAARPAAKAVATDAELASQYPELESAWEEIQVQLGQAQIDLRSQHTVLLLAPEEGWSAALVHSAGLHLFTEAPGGAAPVHAYTTGEGMLLSVSGASAFGTQEADAATRIEALCRRLLAKNPDLPIVRGVVVQFPISWAGQPESVKWAAALRDDLRAIRRTLKVRCPVFALFTQMETAPGFAEFIGRMSSALRQSRCGFAVPSSQLFSGDLVQRGLTWMSGWFNSWILNLMAEDLFNQTGNNELFGLGHEFRRYRKRLRSILEAAFSTHRESEPVLFRGCYFVGTGSGPNDQAFSAGLLRGARGRIFADHLVTEWTQQARDDDRYYRHVALGVGLVGGLLTLLAWVAILMNVAGSPWWWAWWAGPIAVVIAWIVTAARNSRW